MCSKIFSRRITLKETTSYEKKYDKKSEGFTLKWQLGDIRKIVPKHADMNVPGGIKRKKGGAPYFAHAHTQGAPERPRRPTL